MENTCKDCVHFVQHYFKFGKSYQELIYGHCVYPRLKKRETNHKACENLKIKGAKH